ncbi:hypothetical protein [Neisseria canis]|nr:hypothetical protein [Neisseria canis]
MPTAPAPAAAYSTGKPKPDLPPCGRIVVITSLLKYIEVKKAA